MSFLNTDIKRRDELIFKDGFQFERYSYGGIRYFKDLTLDTLKSLKRENFLDASDAQNSSPTIQEFMEFMIEKYHEQTGVPKDAIEKHCRIERLGRECDLA